MAEENERGPKRFEAVVPVFNRRVRKLAQLEAAQDAFVIALRRLRVLEELSAQLRAPQDLQQAHDLWLRISIAPYLLRPHDRDERAANLDTELQAARDEFARVRDTLRLAEAEATLAA